MAPRDASHLNHEEQLLPNENSHESETLKEEVANFRRQIVWRNVVLMGLLHVASLYGLYLCFTQAKWQTILFAYVLYIIGGLGITAGAHRLWTHRSYKATWPLRTLLMACNTLAFQNDIYEWSRDHRVHHKYSETDADPHNATRGFFFSHVGWLLVKKHPLVKARGKAIDMNDLLMDPIVRFQRRYYLPLVALCCFIMPTFLPYFLWGETLWNAYIVAGILKYCVTLNMTWLVNSAAHMWGRHPYDKHIHPAENIAVSLGAVGEGFHNYHHTFPWDYSASELGWKINLTTMFIDFFAMVGWAYDRKSVAPEIVRNRKLKTGDVSERGPYGIH